MNTMARGLVTVTVLLLSCVFVNTDKTLKFYQEKNYHDAQELTDNDVKNLSKLSDLKNFQTILDEILIPRVVGTPNHEKVGNYIVNQMRGFGWDVHEDVFPDHTPVFGTLNFRNIIAKLNPDADRYLVLACHYDSKYTREHVFVGATDSAVPCAMMINLAKVMAAQLEPLKQSRLSLMFIFFDGEEAFRQWGPKDSIYGARHLASQWHEKHYKDGASHLQRMDVLVLLDLLGAPDPVFYSYFQATEKWYVRLAAAEQRLAELNQLQAYTKGKAEQTYFRLRSSGAFIEDDHIPFLRRNVDVLHVIPTPFPDVWHTAGDDMSALDFNTIENLNKILRVFVAEYLHTKP
ncbi:glutaminyl-peptide cyclotransferase-like [Pectinophora gossypiella]|uniref:glutaminyl-peptide cyclotransferase-like n=1 Tax=Pectinophora gossypiella TaxID=13191 RepID=UPI00214EA038|nr:glutaminyl-peptide cyclotransferase-like [Pectinophora gossypiella]